MQKFIVTGQYIIISGSDSGNCMKKYIILEEIGNFLKKEIPWRKR